MKSQYVIIKERKLPNGNWYKANDLVLMTGITEDIIYYKFFTTNGNFGITLDMPLDSIVYTPVIVDVNKLTEL